MIKLGEYEELREGCPDRIVVMAASLGVGC